MQSLCTVLRLGMTQGMYYTRRGLFTCVAAALSVDVLNVDAQPYHLVFRLSTGFVDFVVSTKH